MATTTYLLLLFVSFLSLSTLLVSSASDNYLDDPHDLITTTNLSHTLSNKGYGFMSMILSKYFENTLNHLLLSSPNNITTFTLFCPTDKAFIKLFSKYIDFPYELAQYQVVPLKLNKEILETSISRGSKLETLLPNHPIVITTSPHDQETVSINNVKIVEWDVYNDGRKIVHGVDDFFDLLYPSNNNYLEESTEKKKGYGFINCAGVVGSWVLKHPQLLSLFLVIIAFAVVGLYYIKDYISKDEDCKVDDRITRDKCVALEEDHIKVVIDS